MKKTDKEFIFIDILESVKMAYECARDSQESDLETFPTLMDNLELLLNRYENEKNNYIRSEHKKFYEKQCKLYEIEMEKIRGDFTTDYLRIECFGKERQKIEMELKNKYQKQADEVFKKYFPEQAKKQGEEIKCI